MLHQSWANGETSISTLNPRKKCHNLPFCLSSSDHPHTVKAIRSHTEELYRKYSTQNNNLQSHRSPIANTQQEHTGVINSSNQNDIAH